MRELVRTNDAVLISAIEALLKGARIAHMVVDQNMSVLEGSIGILPRRILVGEDEFAAARRLLAEAGLAGELRPDAALNEPRRARTPSSAAASSCASRCAAIASAMTPSCWRRQPAQAGEHAVDLGAGVGAAGLALARRVDGLAVTLVEIDPELAALARENAARNGLADAGARGLPRCRGAGRRFRRRGARVRHAPIAC